MNPKLSSDLTITVITTTFFRLVLNTARRFVYPFAPVLSRGLGVPLTAITAIIAVNQFTSIFGFLLGPLSDRFGYKKMMLTGLLLLSFAMTSCFFLPFYGVVLAAFFLTGLGKIIFDPAVQAWVGQRVPIHRRGLVIGIMEMSWSGSTLVGIPLTALIIHKFGWQWPFLIMGCFGFIGSLALYFIIPKDKAKPCVRVSENRISTAFFTLLKKRPAMGALGYAFFSSAANDNLFVIYGAWLETSFGLGVVALGIGTIAIGAAELFGEASSAAISDRMGLKQAVIAGLCCSTLSYGLLPFFSSSLPLALSGLFFLFIFFEFTLVTSLSLCTEILPEYRATMMSGFFAAAGAGRVVGALLGGHIWAWGGIAATGIVSSLISIFGIFCLLWGLKGKQPF